jgi:hypothetical protein
MPAKFRPFMKLESLTLATINRLIALTKEAIAWVTVNNTNWSWKMDNFGPCNLNDNINHDKNKRLPLAIFLKDKMEIYSKNLSIQPSMVEIFSISSRHFICIAH